MDAADLGTPKDGKIELYKTCTIDAAHTSVTYYTADGKTPLNAGGAVLVKANSDIAVAATAAVPTLLAEAGAKKELPLASRSLVNGKYVYKIKADRGLGDSSYAALVTFTDLTGISVALGAKADTLAAGDELAAAAIGTGKINIARNDAELDYVVSSFKDETNRNASFNNLADGNFKWTVDTNALKFAISPKNGSITTTPAAASYTMIFSINGVTVQATVDEPARAMTADEKAAAIEDAYLEVKSVSNWGDVLDAEDLEAAATWKHAGVKLEISEPDASGVITLTAPTVAIDDLTEEEFNGNPWHMGSYVEGNTVLIVVVKRPEGFDGFGTDGTPYVPFDETQLDGNVKHYDFGIFGVGINLKETNPDNKVEDINVWFLNDDSRDHTNDVKVTYRLDWSGLTLKEAE